jgi:acetylornithine deacetylase/succinyl-diaminopimelate desuccinylase-like protein
MAGGYTGIGFKTVIPSKACAKLSSRLVPFQDPEKIFLAIESYFQANAPKGLKIKLTQMGGAPAYRSALNSFVVKEVSLAYEEVFGKRCQTLFCGASVPIIVELAKRSGADVAMMGVGLAEDDIHAPNEHFGLDRFELGYLTMGRILSRLSSIRPLA